MPLALVRIASVELRPPLDPGFSFQARIGDADVSTRMARSDRDEAVRHLMAARVPLRRRPDVSRDGKLVVPSEEREHAESAIVRAVDVLAVSRRARRQVSSPIPYVGIQHSTADEAAWLASLDGIELGQHLIFRNDPGPIDLELLVSLADDRVEAVALLAEAFAHQHPSGKYHEFLRFFERAFARKPRQLLAPMVRFFAGTPYGYTRAEIKEWLDVRGASVHGYGQPPILESGIRPLLPRIEQAAIDVLANKASWHDSSTDRRDGWHPAFGTSSRDGNAFIRQHAVDGSVGLQLLDGYNSYPIDLNAVMTSLPANLWAPIPPEMTFPTPLVRIIPDPWADS